jgi:hypothetical protein
VSLRKSVDFVSIIYEGALLGFVGAVSNVILLNDLDGMHRFHGGLNSYSYRSRHNG